MIYYVGHNSQKAYLEVAPPVAMERTGAFREVDVLVWVRTVELVLVADVPRVAVERRASKRVASVLHLSKPSGYTSSTTDREGTQAYHFDGIGTSIVPVVLIGDDDGVLEAVAVHERAELAANLRLIRSGNQGCRVRRVRVLRLVLQGSATGTAGE